MTNQKLFTPAQLEDYLAKRAAFSRGIHQDILDKGPDFMKSWIVSGKAEQVLLHDLENLRLDLQTPHEERLAGTLTYWINTTYGSDDVVPWAVTALGFLRIGEFHIAVSTICMMREHLFEDGPESLNLLTGDSWADFTPRRGGVAGDAIRTIIIRCVEAHPLYRTQDEILDAADDEFRELMEGE
jgi:hypothetical protein